MPNPCYYHPAVAAAGTCVQCGTPGCGECLTQIGDKLACRRCAAAIQSRFGTEPVPPLSVRPLGPANDERRIAASGTRNYMTEAPDETLTPAKVIKGVALAAVVGVLGSIGIEKILFYSHFGFALLYLMLGLGVGLSLKAFTGRGGAVMGLTAAAIMVVCMGVSHFVYAQDLLNSAWASGNVSPGVTAAAVFPAAMANLKFIHWIFVLGGIVVSFTTANQESK